jgi:hypothetical protein
VSHHRNGKLQGDRRQRFLPPRKLLHVVDEALAGRGRAEVDAVLEGEVLVLEEQVGVAEDAGVAGFGEQFVGGGEHGAEGLQEGYQGFAAGLGGCVQGLAQGLFALEVGIDFLF